MIDIIYLQMDAMKSIFFVKITTKVMESVWTVIQVLLFWKRNAFVNDLIYYCIFRLSLLLARAL